MRQVFHGMALISAMALVVPATAHAQGSLSFKGGVSFGNVSNKGVLPGTLSDRTGFAAGIALGSQQGLIGFGIEALFDQRGVKSSATGTGTGYRLDYIDVPAYLRIALPTPGVSPFAYAGPQISFELRCRNVDGACPDGTRKKTDYAGVIGGGVTFGSEKRVSLEGRYIYGLSDLKLGTVTDANSYKTRTFLLLLGVPF